MRKYFRVVSCLVACFSLLACHDYPKDPKVDIPEPPSLDDILDDIKKDPELKIGLDSLPQDLFICFKKESEQQFTGEARKNVIPVTVSLDAQQPAGCSKEGENFDPLIFKSHELGTFEAPAFVNEPVGFIEIKNERTCYKKRFVSQQEILADKKTISVSASGEVKMVLTESFVLSQNLLNVQRGANVVEVSYYGNCTEFKYQPAPDDLVLSEDNVELCEKAPLLGRQNMVIDVSVEIQKTTEEDSLCNDLSNK